MLLISCVLSVTMFSSYLKHRCVVRDWDVAVGRDQEVGVCPVRVCVSEKRRESGLSAVDSSAWTVVLL